MIQKSTKLVPADKCGVWLINIMHVYSKLNFLGRIGCFTKSSIRVTKPNNWLRKKKKTKNIYVRSNFYFQKGNGFSFKCSSNNCMLLKKRLTPRGSKVVGPVDNRLKRKRARASFIKVI